MHAKAAAWNVGDVLRVVELFGKERVRVKPVDDFANANRPKVWREEFLHDRLVEVPRLPPRRCDVLKLNLDKRDRAGGEVEEQSVGLTEPHLVAGMVGGKPQPRRREKEVAMLNIEKVLHRIFIPDAFCSLAATFLASWCGLRAPTITEATPGCAINQAIAMLAKG